MTNEEKIVAGEETLELPEVKEGEEDTTDYKTLASQFASSAKRYKKLFDKEKLKEKVDAKVEKKVDEIESKKDDYATKLATRSYLNSEGVPKDDHEWIIKQAEEAGKDIDVFVDLKWVREELKERKAARETKEALPGTSKRSAIASRDSVEYHLAKETKLSEIEDTDLRRKVHMARLQKSKTGSRFAKRAVV